MGQAQLEHIVERRRALADFFGVPLRAVQYVDHGDWDEYVLRWAPKWKGKSLRLKALGNRVDGSWLSPEVVEDT